MRDIWGVPPGMDPKTMPKRSRGRLKAVIAGTLVMLLGVGGGTLLHSLNESTAVSTKDALAEFRSGAGRSDNNEPGRDTRSAKRVEGTKKKTRDRTRDASTDASAPQNDAVAQAPTGETNAPASGARSAPRTNARRSSSNLGRPAQGVYTWTVDGYEQAPGVKRDLPKRSNRVITYEGATAWVEHHIFSEQKEEWFHLGPSTEGVAVSAVRNRVEMGPVTVDRTVTYDPPAFVSRFPFQQGQTWNGSWSGKTSGTYTGRTLDHGTLRIGGEDVEVWVTEVEMKLRGEVEGRVLTRSWIAPKYRLVVKQYQESEVESGPGDYYSEWMGQVVSVHPRT